MQEKILDKLIEIGLTAEKICQLEYCRHNFEYVQIFVHNDVCGELELFPICTKCDCTVYIAEIMGLNPENYCGDPNEYI